MKAIPIYSTQFTVEVAETPEARARGLMDRTESTGMLFRFDAPTMQSFWNERTHLPLDLLFVDGNGDVVTRHAMQTIQETYFVPTEYRPRAPYIAALELPRSRAPAAARRVLFGPRNGSRAVVLVRT